METEKKRTTLNKSLISYVKEYNDITLENYSECNLKDRSLWRSVHDCAVSEAIKIIESDETNAYETIIKDLSDQSYKFKKYCLMSKTLEAEKLFESLSDEMDEIIFYVRCCMEE